MSYICKRKTNKMKKEISNWLLTDVYNVIGMDKPSNHEEIVEYIQKDVEEVADPINYHSGDFGIAFRRWIEKHNSEMG